eukprot:gene50998-biopygen67770
MPRWWFNSATRKCEEFIFGGCDANANNFETQNSGPPLTQAACASSCPAAPCVACAAVMPACGPGCSDCKVTTVTEGSCTQCAVYKAECRDAPVGLPAGLPGPCAVGPCSAGELCTDVSGGMHTCAPKPQMCCMAAATCGFSPNGPASEGSSTPCTEAEYASGLCTSHAICCHRVY